MNNQDSFDNNQQININGNDIDQNNFLSNNDNGNNNNQGNAQKTIIIL